MFAGAWLSGWLAEISADLREALEALRDDALYKSTYFTFYKRTDRRTDGKVVLIAERLLYVTLAKTQAEMADQPVTR